MGGRCFNQDAGWLQAVRKFRDPEVEAVTYYTSSEEGVSILTDTFDETVSNITYTAEAKERA
jgi:hypothetical protein